MTQNIFSQQVTWLSRVTLQQTELNGNNMITTAIGCFLSPDYQRQFAPQIEAIRALCRTLEDKLHNKEEVKKLKLRLPAVIISGVVQGGIGADNIIQRNGVVSIDIDGKDNPMVHDWEALKREVGRLPFVGYVGRSVSGLGIFALIPILDPTKHKEHFNALVRFFATWEVNLTQQGDAEATELHGLTLDEMPSNIASKRFVSYDPSPVWTSEAEVFEDIFESPTRMDKNSEDSRPLEPRPGMLSSLFRRLMIPTIVHKRPFDLKSFFQKQGIEYEARPRQGGMQYLVHCPWEELHSSHNHAESAVFQYPDGRIGYKCMHAHCAQKNWHDYREFYETQ